MTDAAPSSDPDTKQAAILGAAFDAFTTYGFRRTSMEEIARRAGMSRPALYLHFANKEEIFRALIRSYFDTTVEAMRAELWGRGHPSVRLERAFATKCGPVMETLLGSAHGPEFIDTKNLHGAEESAAGEARLIALMTEWLEREYGLGTIRLEASAEETALTIMGALNGLMAAAPDFDSYCRQLRQLGRMLGRGLEV